jgi:hypothetical protein
MDVLAKQHQIEIEGTNEWVNLSPYIKEDVILQDSAMAFGAIKTTCNIQINSAVGLNIDLKRNWAQWERGKSILVKVKDSGGNLHQVKSLHLLKTKYDDGQRALGERYQPQKLSLELGCVLSLRDTRDLKTDDNGVTWTGPVLLITYVNQWLSYFGLGQLITLATDPNPNQAILGPIGYDGGSISEFLGRMVYGYAQCHLYSDHLGRLRLCKANQTPTSAFIDVNSVDLPVDRRSPTESEIPAGLIYVTATPEMAIIRSSLPDATSTTTTRNLRHVETISTQLIGNTEIVTRTGVDTPIGISVNSTPVLAKSWKETLTRVFGGPYNALQSKTIIRTETPKPQSNTVSIGQVETRNEEYEYTYDDIVNVKITNNVKTKPPTAPTTGGGSSVNIDEFINVKIQEWMKRFEDIWAYLIYEYRPTDDENAADPSTTLDEGENQPPATQFRPSDFILKTRKVNGKADLGSTPGIDAKHQRTFNLGQFCPSQTEAEAIAFEQGLWMIGRYHGQNLAYPIDDAWLSNPPPPLFNLFIVDKAGVQDAYVLNSHAIFLGATESYGGGAGIWIGVRDRTTGTITPPYQIPATTQSYLRTTIGYLLNATGGKIIIGG